MNPFDVVRQFEAALSEYTGAPYVVTTTSCTMALLLAVAYHLKCSRDRLTQLQMEGKATLNFSKWNPSVEIPKRTYVGVPMSIIHAGGRPTFRDEEWKGAYRLEPLLVWDAARRFTSRMYQELYRYVVDNRVIIAPQTLVCVSFHWSKILGIQQGGAILTADEGAAAWLRRARFDGRAEGVAVKEDDFPVMGWHCYMSPEVAAEGLMRLSLLPLHNEDLPNSDYPDLSTIELFK